MDKKREIYIKIERIHEIIALIELIKKQEKELNDLFNLYDQLSLEENKLFENWNYYFEEIIQKLDYITL